MAFDIIGGMKAQNLRGLEARLTHFLEDLLAPMGRRERRHWARVDVQGLLLDGECKSIEPMASRIQGADVQALRQFVGQSPWAVDEVQRRLAHKVIDLLSEAEVWIIDETSFPKAGQHSVGVARQYCGTLGKIANCQVAVSLHWRIDSRFLLPERCWLPHVNCYPSPAKLSGGSGDGEAIKHSDAQGIEGGTRAAVPNGGLSGTPPDLGGVHQSDRLSP